MRTPDGEEEGTQAPGAESGSGLAVGFGQAEAESEGQAEGGGVEGDDAFGSGWPGEADSGGAGGEEAEGDGTELFATGQAGAGGDAGGGSEDTVGAGDFGADDSFAGAEEDMAAFDGGSELSAFEFESDYVPDTDTDWDVSGDGVVDGHDFHEASTGLNDFHVDAEDSHGHAQNEGFFHTD